jgi:hypothetical protein
MALIEAALRAGVERFIPAEFEGPPSLRQPTSPLDRGRSAALALLRHYESQGMAHTIFVCGILYERFAPGGMRAANIGGSCGASGEGGYLLDVRSMRSQIPYDSSGHPAMICMTSAQDVGKSIVAALNLPQLPRELRMYGTRMDVSAIVHVAELFRRKTCLSFLMFESNKFQDPHLKEQSILPTRCNLLLRSPERPKIETKKSVFGCSLLQVKASSTLTRPTLTEWSILLLCILGNGFRVHGLASYRNLDHNGGVGSPVRVGCFNAIRSAGTI